MQELLLRIWGEHGMTVALIIHDVSEPVELAAALEGRILNDVRGTAPAVWL